MFFLMFLFQYPFTYVLESFDYLNCVSKVVVFPIKRNNSFLRIQYNVFPDFV